MSEVMSHPLQRLDEDAALRTILEGTATGTGERFFAALVENPSGALGTRGAWVTEYLPATRRLGAPAFRLNGERIEGWEMAVDGLGKAYGERIGAQPCVQRQRAFDPLLTPRQKLLEIA
jgi:hypothetical protein